MGVAANPRHDFGHEEAMDPSDSLLWARTREGDRESFGLLFDRHARTIYNYCFRRVGDRAAAEDLLSIVFLEAWRRRDQNVPPGKLLPWLFGIATNVVRNRRRSERRFAAALRRMPRPQPEPRFDDLADARLDAEQTMRALLALVARLPQPDRDVFVLCSWMELSYEDAAFALDIPIGTVRSRLWRARKRLSELEPNSDRTSGGSPTTQEALDP